MISQAARNELHQEALTHLNHAFTKDHCMVAVWYVDGGKIKQDLVRCDFPHRENKKAVSMLKESLLRGK